MYEGKYASPRGHRRGDAVRLRLPDGPAPAARPDRPRHGVRDPRDDVPPGPRPAARALADPQADGHRRHARPQDRPRLLHLRGPGQPDHRRRRPDPVARTTSRSCGTTSRTVGVVGTGTMASRHRRGLRQGRATTCCSSAAQPGQGRRRRARRSPRTSTSRSSAAGPPRTTRPRCSARVTGSHLARRPQGRRHRGRGDRRGPRGQDHAVRQPRRHLQAGRDPGHHDLVAADHRAGQGHRPARRTSSACTSSTRRR